MSADYTPGQWGTFLTGSNKIYVNAVTGQPPHEQYTEVAVVPPDEDGLARADDAELIAAAPEMLDLLRRTLDVFYLDPNSVAQGRVIHAIEAFLWKLDGNE